MHTSIHVNFCLLVHHPKTIAALPPPILFNTSHIRAICAVPCATVPFGMDTYLHSFNFSHILSHSCTLISHRYSLFSVQAHDKSSTLEVIIGLRGCVVKYLDSNSIGDEGGHQGRIGVNSDDFLRCWTKGASTPDLIVTEFWTVCGQTDLALACVLCPLNRLVLYFKTGGVTG